MRYAKYQPTEIAREPDPALGLSPEGLRDPVFYLVSDPSEGLKLLLLRSRSSGRVRKAFVNDLSCSGRLAGKLSCVLQIGQACLARSQTVTARSNIVSRNSWDDLER